MRSRQPIFSSHSSGLVERLNRIIEHELFFFLVPRKELTVFFHTLYYYRLRELECSEFIIEDKKTENVTHCLA